MECHSLGTATRAHRAGRALQGQATVQHAGGTQAVPLRSQNAVYREDIIQTLKASKIKLVLLEGTELTLSERGTMTLSKFVYTP